jgi:dUTP pyrophosphatase
MKINAKLADPKLRPVRAHATDAGADLRSLEDVEIYPGEQKLVDTGVAVMIPPNFVGLVFNRSSQGKIGVQLANSVGVIDSDYRGNIKVLLKNNGEDPYIINQFETRIAQLVIVPVLLADYIDTHPDDWENTQRGTGGFGSTGT